MNEKYQGDSLGLRMKGYEAVTQSMLLRRTPVIIRIDGRAFHTFTKKLIDVDPSNGLTDLDPSLQETPFSIKLHDVMLATASILFNTVQGCVFAYTQSDEISLLLRDWDTHETQSWFGSNVQKIVSISASIATAAFNYSYDRNIQAPKNFSDLAQFDSRVYNVPFEEVANYFIWRQQDCSRNSIQMFGHFYFSQKQMHQKNNSEVQDMLMAGWNVNWNDFPTWMKRGSCIIKNPKWSEASSFNRTQIDNEIPIFTQDRQYIEKLLIGSEREQIKT